MTLELRSELLDFERTTFEGFEAARKAVAVNTDEEIITRTGNQHRFELLDGQDLPEDCNGYFDDDRRGIEFIVDSLEDPTWETLMMASSMHCGGFYDNEVFEKVVNEVDGDFGGDS